MKESLFVRLAITAVLSMPILAARADDQDHDGIDDVVEQQLLDLFAPVINGDQGCSGGWVSGVPVPVEPSWFLRNGRIMLNGTEIARSLSLTNFIENYCTRNDMNAMNIAFVHPGNLWGFSTIPGDSISWAQSAQSGAGIFGRVWRPWSSYPNLYSVQYYMLLTCNQSIVTCAGFHDGDWLCVDYCVDTAWPGKGPFIRHAVYHVHGKQLLMTRESLEFEGDHPVVYLEPGVNEPWPNRSSNSGVASWPLTNGFAKNWLWNEGLGAVNEENVTARHAGAGCRYLSNGARPIRNLGERGYPIGTDLEAKAVNAYAGKWGFEAGGCWLDAFFDSDNPEGPPVNRKMWDREFTFAGTGTFDAAHGAPFSTNDDPIRPNIDRTMRFADEPYGGCNAEDPGFLYSACNAYLLPIAYSWQGWPTLPQGGDGRRINPFPTLNQGLDHVAAYGVLRVAPTSFPGSYTISKPMTIEAYQGTATIGK